MIRETNPARNQIFYDVTERVPAQRACQRNSGAFKMLPACEPRVIAAYRLSGPFDSNRVLFELFRGTWCRAALIGTRFLMDTRDTGTDSRASAVNLKVAEMIGLEIFS